MLQAKSSSPTAAWATACRLKSIRITTTTNLHRHTGAGQYLGKVVLKVFNYGHKAKHVACLDSRLRGNDGINKIFV